MNGGKAGIMAAQSKHTLLGWGGDVSRIVQTLAAVWVFALALVVLLAQPVIDPST